ncbi:MAG: PVC-type heme-binding CxxCH protein, partial [Limisphaerales bacterium]
GRLYVVEMRDYSERRPERLGRVRRLEDRDGDGRFEAATVFLDGLPWPTAVTCWDGGVFVGATPDILFAKDEDDDGRADVRETVFTGFAADFAPFAPDKLNVQALMNSFQWGPDARIHGATGPSGGRVALADNAFTRAWRAAVGFTNAAADTLDLRGRDFSFDPRTLGLRTEPGGGQHGMTFDDAGRKFVCSNSDHIQWIAYDPAALGDAASGGLPPARRSIAADGPAAPVFRLSPDEPWRVLRTRWRVTGLVPGLIEGGGRASGYFTSATGLTIYRGDAYGAEFSGDAFVADCGSNLIHRKKITPHGAELVAARPADEQGREFLASRDTWFRPVQFANAPDGCLWFADMYREVIEHPWSLPPGIKRQLDLNAGNDRGRLYRIVPDGVTPRRRTDLSGAGTAELVALLGHANGWHRDSAARLLHERHDPAAFVLLAAMNRHDTNAPGRLAALRLLGAWGGLADEALLAALRDDEASVRAAAVALAAERYRGGALPLSLAAKLPACCGDRPEVRLAAVLALAEVRLPERAKLLALLVTDEGLVRDLAVATAGDDAVALWRELLAGTPRPSSELLGALAAGIGRRARAGEIRAVLAGAARLPGGDLMAVAARLAEGLPHGAALTPSAALNDLLAHARRLVGDAAAGSAQVDAIRLLARVAPDDAALRKALEAGRPVEAQRAAVVALLGARGGASAGVVLGAWPQLASGARTEAVTLLLRDADGTRRLLAALKVGAVPVSDLRAGHVAALRQLADAGLRAQARALLGEPVASRDAAVASRLGALARPGDAGRGREIFRAQCAPCHRLAGEGHALGPDLESVAGQPPEQLLVAILDPNREMAPNHFSREIETHDGELFSGLPMEAPAGELRLRAAGGGILTVPAGHVRRDTLTGRSLMPEGFEATLSEEQLADLLALLTTRR